MAMDIEKIKGVLLMLSAAFFFTIASLLIKILGPSYRVWDIAVYRLGGGAVILLVLLGWKQNLIKPYNTKLMVLWGITGAISFITFVLAIQLIPLSTAVLIYYAFPAFSAILSPIMFGDRIMGKEILCVAAALVGVAFLFDFQLIGVLFGQFMALVGAAFTGFSMTLVKKLREDNGPEIIQLYYCLVGTILFLAPFAKAPKVPGLALEWIIVIGLIITSVLAQHLMNQGFVYCKSWEGGIIMTSQVVFSSIFGIFLYGDPVTWRFLSGSLLIFSSAVAYHFSLKNLVASWQSD